MTIVEFFDISPMQNLSSALRYTDMTENDSIWFVGSNRKKINKTLDVYKRIFNRFGIKAKVNTLDIGKYDMENAVERLCEIAGNDEKVIFDVAGGTDYLLAAAGIAAGKCKNVSLVHTSVRSGKTAEIGAEDAQDSIKSLAHINLSCDEVIELHGGKIVYSDDKKGGTNIWRFDHDGFFEDIKKIWSICRKHSRTWNKRCSAMGELENFAESRKFISDSGILNVAVKKETIKSLGKKELVKDISKHLEELSLSGLIKNLVNSEKELSFSYKNAQVRQCLLKAGNALELFTHISLMNAKNRKGNTVYGDSLCGVVIDWDGIIDGSGPYDTENEIDVFAVKGMIPVFVSCKNGNVDENELYKLNTVAERFGVKYAKKVLVATDLQKSQSALVSFLARAKEMDIKIIDGVHRMSSDELSKRLSSV